MHACHCTNQCPGCGSCCQTACGCRRSGGQYVTTTGTGTVPIGVGVTEDRVREILREELSRAARSTARALPSARTTR